MLFRDTMEASRIGATNTFPALTKSPVLEVIMAKPSLPDFIIDEKLKARFWKFVDVRSPDECWEWTGFRLKGYGQLCVKRSNGGFRNVRAHRLSWALANGRMPELSILHSCDNPPCVNPKHLREGTQRENIQEALMRDRMCRNRGYCRRGHPLTQENAYYRYGSTKNPQCRTCRRDSKRLWTAKRRGVNHAS